MDTRLPLCIILMSLKPFGLCWASVLAPVFTKLSAFELLGLKVLMDVQSLLWLMALNFRSTFWRDFKCVLYSNFNDLFRVVVNLCS